MASSPLTAIPDKPLSKRLARLFEIGCHPLAEVETSASREADCVLETIRFKTAKGEMVRGLLAKPLVSSGRRPAILHIHAHGNNYSIGALELIQGRPALQEPPGSAFVRQGYIVLCIDLPCFGERAAERESASAKAALWHGMSLAGQMVGELSSALAWLSGRADVDPRRVGCYGISMGATLGYWLAAVDTRISALAQLCCFADFDRLIETGAHDLHGIYLSLPGLLDVASNGRIAGLVAPRPQLICIGDQDPLTPPSAVDIAWKQAADAYRRNGAADKLYLHRETGTGHRESREMRSAVLDFFAANLGRG
jgi:dienelactone hydrolase